ncbi:MAG TPA: S9 family peptidase [Vicinamibacterales bacterium]|jgi:dipeptidyl aminopeptidase/acylaminoacyl peptidase
MSTTTSRLFVAAAAAAVIAGAALHAQEIKSTTLLTTEHYLDWERVSDAQISPDGTRIVYTRQSVNKQEDKWESALWILNADGSQHRFLVKGQSARWSPDGKRLMYLAEGEPKGSQLFVRWVDADGPATQITHVAEAPRNAKWSPDGKWVAFAAFVPEQEKWAISMPAEPKGAKWTPAPRVVSTLHYRQDQVGFLEDGNTHLFVVPADGGTARQLTSGKWSVGAGELRAGASIDWTPDGKSILFDGNRSPDSDTQYQTSVIYVADVASGAIRELVNKPGAWGKPAVSPDGRTVAFTGYGASGHTHTVSDLYVVPIAGGSADMRKISGDYDRDPINMRWAPDNTGIYFDADDSGARNVQFASIVGGVKPVTSGRRMLSFDSVSKDLVAAGISADLNRPQDVVKFSLKQPGQVTQLTDVNGDVLQGIQLAKVDEITYPSSGNAKVMGWIYRPPSFDPSKKYPLILEIHGGPFGNYNVGFNYMFQNFAANGFVVLVTNPRGSTGYGSEFINGIDHNYPGPDFDDLMAGVDTVVGRGYVDTSRMYVSGCSGGGVLSSWVIGHTDRFAAAAVRCPVTDWLSMAGHTDVPLFTYSFFKKPFWEDPSDWLSHSSLMSVGKVTTPTLLMTGVLDRRTPMPQTEEYYAALKVRGIPVKLLEFADEFHGTGSKPSNYIRTQLYMMSWFNKYTRQSGGRISTTASQP